MTLSSRFVLAALVAIAPPAIALSSCGTNAVGTQACREIELARCQFAPLCSPGFDVGACQRFYRDQCLAGIEDTAPDASDLNTAGNQCAAALTTVAGCVPGGGSSAAACEAVIPDASCYEIDASATACNIILDCPEVTPACNFIGSLAPVVDAGSDADASDDGSDDASDDAQDGSDDGGDAGDAGDDAADAATD